MSEARVTALFKMSVMGVVGNAKHGGARVGAGRKRSGKPRGGPHRRRPTLSPRHPVHVTLRLVRPMMPLRRGQTYDAIRRVLARFFGRTDFRVVHVSIQDNHLHFLIEAHDRRALSLGMQSLGINLAREINTALGNRCGKVFAERYHATQITTAKYARHALAYVLNNWRRHQQDYHNGRQRPAKLDPYASGISFTGWTGGVRFATPAGYPPLPVSPPETALLRHEWRRHGEIDPFELPGPATSWPRRAR